MKLYNCHLELQVYTQNPCSELILSELMQDLAVISCLNTLITSAQQNASYQNVLSSKVLLMMAKYQNTIQKFETNGVDLNLPQNFIQNNYKSRDCSPQTPQNLFQKRNFSMQDPNQSSELPLIRSMLVSAGKFNRKQHYNKKNLVNALSILNQSRRSVHEDDKSKLNNIKQEKTCGTTRQGGRLLINYFSEAPQLSIGSGASQKNVSQFNDQCNNESKRGMNWNNLFSKNSQPLYNGTLNIMGDQETANTFSTGRRSQSKKRHRSTGRQNLHQGKIGSTRQQIIQVYLN